MTLVALLLIACTPKDPATTDDSGAETGAHDDDTGGSSGGGSSGGSSGGDSSGGGSSGGSGGGSSGGSGGSGGDTGDDPGDPAPDLRETGPSDVTVSTDSAAVAGGCTLEYTRYTPDGAAPDTLVVLGHGFGRSAENMLSWGAHLASWGLDVVVPSLCHSSAWDADHEQNGEDMAALADLLGADRVIYAGHSAGGLAAIFAGGADPDAIAVLGLDPVDTTIGVDAAAALTVPFYAVIGEGSFCNSYNNSEAMLDAAADHRGLRAVEADHCDFERPTDSLCTAFCTGTNDTWSDDQIASTIDGLATAFLVWQAGLEPSGEGWWTPGGEHYEELLDEGHITEL